MPGWYVRWTLAVVRCGQQQFDYELMVRRMRSIHVVRPLSQERCLYVMLDRWIWGATGNYIFINSWFDMIPTKFLFGPDFSLVFEFRRMLTDQNSTHDDFPSKGHQLPWWSFKAFCGHVSTGYLARMQPSRRLFKPSMRQWLWLMGWSHWRSSKLAYDLGLIWLVSFMPNNWATSTSFLNNTLNN